MKSPFRALAAVLCAALFAGSVLATSASAFFVFSPDASSSVPDGMLRLPVTSSMADAGYDTAVLFDGSLSDAPVISFTKDAPSFTLKTAFGIPKVLSAFSLYTEKSSGGLVKIAVYGTNDNTEQKWTPVTTASHTINGWTTVLISEPSGGWSKAEKYAFYKFVFTMDTGSSLTLSEMNLFRPDGLTEYVYGFALSVTPGSTPPIVEIPARSSHAGMFVFDAVK